MPTLYVERLTIRAWFGTILPLWLRNDLRGGARQRHRCYVFDSHRYTLALARGLGRWLGWRVEPLPFRLVDVRDAQGLLVRLRIAYQDLAEVQSEILQAPLFQGFTGACEWDARHAPVYVAKALASTSMMQRSTLLRALLLIQVCAWHRRQLALPDEAVEPVLVMERHPWLDAMSTYAHRAGITIHPVAPAATLRDVVRGSAAAAIWQALRGLRDHLHRWQPRCHRGAQPFVRSSADPSQARLGVEYYGQLNLRHPECYSDLFFWQQSSLPAQDIVTLFGLARDPLNEQKRMELREHGLQALVIHPRATTVADVPIHRPRDVRPTSSLRLAGRREASDALEGRWLNHQLRAYTALRDRWADLCEAHQIKVHVSWYKYDATHCAMTDALRRVGGVSVIYQRAYEEFPSAETTIGADVVFGFSSTGVDLERRSHSRIAYRVTTGYLGDHRFALLRARAGAVRAALQQHGARRILAFCDENSHDEERWSLGHSLTRRNYAFVLETVLRTPWLGLVIKPKAPATLRQRLGPVSRLLVQAEATGRCFIYQEGTLQGAYPPAAAALAADVFVHGHLCAATAGMEAALAGVPALLMDGEGWSISPLYQLGVGRVVFTEWDHLWRACVEHWHRPGGLPGFGDWSPILPELDPFRDGRAAERMGTYLQWLLEGFRHGVSRETVLADAAERYQSRWGREMVQHVNVDPTDLAGARRDAPLLQPASAGIHGA